MTFIKHLLYLLLLPTVMYGQTVHIDDGRIVYKGAVKVGQINKDELYETAKQSIYDNIKESKANTIKDDRQNGKICVKGIITLATPYEIIRTVGYVLELSVEEGGYKYRIDSVYMKQVQRGGRTMTVPSTVVFKGIEATGPEAVEAEKLLNEIDLNFQKILTLISNDISKQAVVKTQ
ncbi:MAG: DUF4468 domain-containing protein [Chitinophagales bacterium]